MDIILRYSDSEFRVFNVELNTKFSELLAMASEKFGLDRVCLKLQINGIDIDNDTLLQESEITADEPFVDVVVKRNGLMIFKELQKNKLFTDIDFNDSNLGKYIYKKAKERNRKIEHMSLILDLLNLISDDKSLLTKLFFKFAESSSDEVFDLILEYVDINTRDEIGANAVTGLAMYVDFEYISQVKRLISKGADVNITLNDTVENNDNSALIISSSHGHTDLVKELLKAGANINYINNDGDTALAIASLKGHREIVEELLKAGTNVNHANDNGDTALTLASWKGHGKIVKELLEAGANVNHVDNNGESSLITVSREGYEEIVKELLEAGAKVNHANNNKDTALTLASWKGHKEIVKELLKAGTNINYYTNSGNSSLALASWKGHGKIVKELLEAGAEVNHANNNGDTALAFASCRGHKEIVKELLEAGVDVNHANNNGDTALAFASWGGYKEIVKELLKAGSNVDHVTDGKNSSLHLALKGKHYNIAKEILKYCPDVNLKDKNGKTAIMMTSDYSIIKKLIYQGATDIDQCEVSPLILAVKNNDFRLVKMILAQDIDINRTDKDGNSAIHYARTNKAILREILKKNNSEQTSSPS